MIFDFLTALISPVTNVIEKIITKDEDLLKVKSALMQIQTGFAEKALDYEKQILQMQTDVITAEAKSESWLTRSWRPIAMLSFVGLCVWSYTAKAFGVPSPDLPPDLWTVIKIGLGGYTVGRSAEKIVPALVESLKKKDDE